jgi:YD repeat-containing protein
MHVCISLVGLLAMLWPFTSPARACGPEWLSTDEIGYGFYSQTLAALTIGKEEIPLTIQFTPLTVTRQQLFGSSWQAPLLESFATVSDNAITVHAPDGSEQTFIPSAKSGDIYANPNGWAGEKKDSSFIIYSSCGWRITYRDNRITELKTKDSQLLKWNYADNRLVSVTNGKNTLCQLIYNADGQLQAVSANDEHLSFAYQKQPKIDKKQFLLSAVSWKNGTQEHYEYLLKASGHAALRITTRSKLILGREWDMKTNSLVSTDPL